MAIAGAIGTGEVVMGSLYMIFFGLGTIPMMLAISLAGNMMSMAIRKKINKLIPVLIVLVGIFFILRGLSLGIPFLSPPKEKIEKKFEKSLEEEQTAYKALGGDDKPLKWESKIKVSDDLVFSHAVHAEGSVKCEKCHYNIKKVQIAAQAGDPSMIQCMQCHNERGDDNDCKTCHIKTDRDVAPDSHERAWIVLHGTASRECIGGRKPACGWCHTQSACLNCHRIQKPQDHTQIWKEIEHGTMAKLDRTRCAVCHESNLCARCHNTVLPRP